MTWFRRNVLGQYLSRILLALGSATVAVLLSFVPYDAILQAIWVVVSSLTMGLLFVRQRLNESDDQRYQRLFRSRFEFLAKTEPEALTTVFADNIREPVLKWFENDEGFNLKLVRNIDALDSLARSGDRPGQLLLRLGFKLGAWFGEIRRTIEPLNSETTRKALEQYIDKFIQDHRHLLGEQVAPGIFLRELQPGDQRPVGIHMFSPDSLCAFTIEHYDKDQPAVSVSLSLKREIFAEYLPEQWKEFVAHVHQLMPYFRPLNGGSGPQKPSIPLFVAPGITDWEKHSPNLRDTLIELAAPLVALHS